MAYEIAEDGGKCEIGLEFLELGDDDRIRIEQLFEKDDESND